MKSAEPHFSGENSSEDIGEKRQRRVRMTAGIIVKKSRRDALRANNRKPRRGYQTFKVKVHICDASSGHPRLTKSRTALATQVESDMSWELRLDPAAKYRRDLVYLLATLHEESSPKQPIPRGGDAMTIAINHDMIQALWQIRSYSCRGIGLCASLNLGVCSRKVYVRC